MAQLTLKRAGGIAYREAEPAGASDRSPVLCVHGWPQSSYMWRHLLPALASAGRRALAPDLPGFGDSPPDPPGTFERHVEAVERFRREIGLDRVVLIVHDTGGLIGLRWACDHPEAVAGLVITNTGFFPDHEWIEIAETMRTPIQGEALVDSLSREGFGTLLEEASSEIDKPAIDEYWKAFTTRKAAAACSSSIARSSSTSSSPTREARGARGAHADPLGPGGRIPPGRLRVPLRAEIPSSKLVLLEGVRHFLFEDEPERCAQEVLAFLEQAGL